MIQKLRRKFVIINMLLVTSVLLIALGGLCITNANRYRTESENVMRSRLFGQGKHGQPGGPAGTSADVPEAIDESIPAVPDLPGDAAAATDESTAETETNTTGKQDSSNRKSIFDATLIFVVTLDKNDEILNTDTPGSSTLSDSDIQEAVTAALATTDDSGVLSSLNLRFMKSEINSDTGEMKIAFADTQHETAALKTLFLTSILVFVIALLAFFVISVFLSRWALRPVEKAWEQQNQFIADASHELKTPLTVILANLRILSSHKDATIAEEAKWFENTQAEASRMKELVENLLFLARSDAGAAPSPHNTFSLSDLIWNCILPFESVAFEEGITIQEDIQPDLNFFGDSGQFKQLLAILLDNACKYAGGIKEVLISLKQENGKILLSVSNTGDVLTKEELERVFERFYRADKSRARKEGGYGLGLAIAQTIVTAHKGKIGVSSDACHGTTFTCSFNLANMSNTKSNCY